MKLDLVERESALWKKLEEELNKELQELRVKNDATLPAQETDIVRGQIRFCKRILGWAEPTPKITGD